MKNPNQFTDILFEYNLNSNDFKIEPFGDGLINNTFKLVSKLNNCEFILQKINRTVFKNSLIIFKNLNLASQFLDKYHAKYLFISPLKTYEGCNFVFFENEYWRLFNFLPNSTSFNTLENPKMAFEAAKSFANLTYNLNGIDLNGFEASISNFHNLSFRWTQFQKALTNANGERKTAAAASIDFYVRNYNIVEQFDKIQKNLLLPLRMMHHDTKINNVLFDKTSRKALAVCDLDTLMPGLIISDLGDIVRTYCCEFSENHREFSEVKIRLDYYQAIYNGYLKVLKSSLTKSEIEHLFYAGQFMIYMQGLRFLSDYLNNDCYYPISYKDQNLDRAKNQQYLLMDLLKNQTVCEGIIEKSINT